MKLYNWQVFLTNYSINSLFPSFPEWCLRGTKLYWLSKTQNFEINLSDCKWDFSLIVEQYLILNPVIKANWMLKWQDVTLFWRCHLQMFSPIPSLPCSYCKSRVHIGGCSPPERFQFQFSPVLPSPRDACTPGTAQWAAVAVSTHKHNN